MKNPDIGTRLNTQTKRTAYFGRQKKPVFVLQKVFKSAKSSSMIQVCQKKHRWPNGSWLVHLPTLIFSGFNRRPHRGKGNAFIRRLYFWRGLRFGGGKGVGCQDVSGEGLVGFWPQFENNKIAQNPLRTHSSKNPHAKCWVHFACADAVSRKNPPLMCFFWTQLGTNCFGMLLFKWCLYIMFVVFVSFPGFFGAKTTLEKTKTFNGNFTFTITSWSY